MYVRVVPFQKTFDSRGLMYFIPEHLESVLQPYQIVSIPIREKIELWVTMEIITDIGDEIEEEKIKSLVDIHNPEVFLSSYQADIIDYISQHYITPIHNALWVFFPKNLQEKISKNTLQKVTTKEYNYTNTSETQLTPVQEKAYQQIQSSTNNKKLFYGITGSGKTEIYQKIISENLKKERQTLLLIPEIILWNQIGERMQEVFWPDVIVISSTVTEAKKTQYWVDIRSGNAKVIVGTRSALFYPYSNLGTIIVDEEHDQSYNSDSAPRYNGIDVVCQMSDLLNIPVILASGTPSVKSMYTAMKGEYELVNLLTKYM